MSTTGNDYTDAGHRPHARHTGETPQNTVVHAPQHLTVTLDSWGPTDNLFPAMYDALQANWGDKPSRAVRQGYRPDRNDAWPDVDLPDITGWNKLTDAQRAYIEACFAKKTLQQVLERITFSFLVDGCTRACTHQLVRSRIGAAMMQHGGRDNDWRHRPWVMPETIRRACMDQEQSSNIRDANEPGIKSCITSWNPVAQYLGQTPSFDTYHSMNIGGDPSLRQAIYQYLDNGRRLYAALVDAGIPWEDARRLLWMGTATYIHLDYNYIALRDVLANRLEHIMDWEINCVAQLMLREIKMKCPPIFSAYLGSASDLAGRAMRAGLESWPPDGKYPNPFERCTVKLKEGDREWVCGEPKYSAIHNDAVSGQYVGARLGYHPYQGADSIPREHRPEQNPFWVLAPSSMNGGPIKWLPTNGTYPHEAVAADRTEEGL